MGNEHKIKETLQAFFFKIYIQVAYKLENEQVVKREFGNLLNINDQYPKYVVTMDEFWKDSIEGVQHLYITDFLMKEAW